MTRKIGPDPTPAEELAASMVAQALEATKEVPEEMRAVAQGVRPVDLALGIVRAGDAASVAKTGSRLSPTTILRLAERYMGIASEMARIAEERDAEENPPPRSRGIA